MAEDYAQQAFERKYPSAETRYARVGGALDWRIWERDQIWIKNSTGQEVKILVHWLQYPLKELLRIAVEGNAGLEGAGIGPALDWVYKKEQCLLVANDGLPANHSGFDAYDLGGGGDAAYVTAYTCVNGEPRDFICSRVVARRHSIEFKSPAFTGTTRQMQVQLAAGEQQATNGNDGTESQQTQPKCRCSIM